MERKRIYQHCLLIGISLLLALASCHQSIDYWVRAEWIYINETSQPIGFSARGFDTIIAPMDSFIISEDSEGPKNVSEESYEIPFTDPIVNYGSSQCLTYDPVNDSIGKGEGPFGLENYEREKLAERYYEFTYRFTEEEFAEAEDCE